MQLTQSEIIQILRKRAGLNQAELGSRAFNTTIDSGRTKIKNIELGKQRATDDDLERIANCLELPLEQLLASSENNQISSRQNPDLIQVSQKVVDMFPDLGDYLEMLEKASLIDDLELIEYLSQKLADIWRAGPRMDDPSAKRTAKTT
jgi:transcriptional regulator with XRE-family HTH domain